MMKEQTDEIRIHDGTNFLESHAGVKLAILIVICYHFDQKQLCVNV